jgi:rSAM/selenodomain-associated transferase 2
LEKDGASSGLIDISVIIPTYNEAEHIGRLVTRLLRLDPAGWIREILVVDGGSDDNTVQIAQRAGATVVTDVGKGRARQMNAGAERASSQSLLFIHADSIPPNNLVPEVHRMVDGGAEAGCFQLAFDWNHPTLTFYAWCTRFHALPFRFGDQGLWVTSNLFRQVGGFDESLIVMEDNKIVDALRRRTHFEISPAKMLTSARKYRQNGVFRLQVIFMLIFVGFYAGYSQENLLKLYNRFIFGGKV